MYKEREILFNSTRTDWPKIQELEYLLQPYYHMWIGLVRWNTNSKDWLESGFNKLNGNEIDQGMIKHLEIFSEVGEKAYREAKFEEKLKGIEMKWKEIFFVLTENKYFLF